MFLTTLKTEYLRNGLERLTEDLIWDDGTNRITVPRWFLTDFASIPPILQGVLKKNGNSKPAAVLHDALYKWQIKPRIDCDRIFRAALLAYGVPARGARLYYLGVRAGGRATWKRYAKLKGAL